ncbi:uncharacterized protein EV420DRAFT_1477812 [Desarmillaria tabescens]|uniref:Protein prenylyltransferase n=1 Tax=Armillaria tabescens TaxID=1929756 RepID=A0AA39N8D6_ARMTA|nr:uncharacterized protein EV420DRAFT_1477812 [Desarmillaria tabescens]KAK0460930.1 hypothetical protein EV420DRAFT_1477812 [Desarmillaria tabescens]
MTDSERLVYSLSTILHDLPASIEILPGGIEEWPSNSPDGNKSPFLLFEGHLGVPHKTLYKLYLVANTMFTTARRQVQDHGALIASSIVILLLNSAHQTALNARKRLIILGKLDANKELVLTGTMISGNRECAKQSMIWAHRRWIFEQLYPPNPPSLPHAQLPLALVRNELRILAQSCELYPRNYYAWIHRSYCMQSIMDLVIATPSPAAEAILEEEYLSLLRWIDLHVSDYSAMHYLCLLVQRFSILQFSTPRLQSINPISLFDHAMSLLSSYPKHEALWMYVRTIIASVVLVDRAAMIARVKSSSEGGGTYALQLLAFIQSLSTD